LFVPFGENDGNLGRLNRVHLKTLSRNFTIFNITPSVSVSGMKKQQTRRVNAILISIIAKRRRKERRDGKGISIKCVFMFHHSEIIVSDLAIDLCSSLLHLFG
jgi:hypothetical protein